MLKDDSVHLMAPKSAEKGRFTMNTRRYTGIGIETGTVRKNIYSEYYRSAVYENKARNLTMTMLILIYYLL